MNRQGLRGGGACSRILRPQQYDSGFRIQGLPDRRSQDVRLREFRAFRVWVQSLVLWGTGFGVWMCA